MAPDLNSIPSSPIPPGHTPSNPSSRRPSRTMAPPPLPLSSPITPSNTTTHSNGNAPLVSPSLSGPGYASATGDNTGVGTGPGPMRHPRPLTAADLHLVLEKEQEAVVNRLTRELSQLRAQHSASVVSNTSSTSGGLPDVSDPNSTNHMLSGPSYPVPSQRRHTRSSSSTSIRSATTNPTTASVMSNASGSTAGWTTAGTSGSVASGVAGTTGAHITTLPSQASTERIRDGVSRQNSMTSSRRSGASSPAIPFSEPFPQLYQHRPSISSHHQPPGLAHNPIEQVRSTSVSSTAGTARYQEAAFHRSELDAVQRENEALKRRIRDLERVISNRRQSDATRQRSESMTSAASVTSRSEQARGRATQKHSEEDGVRVGESAASVGVGGDQ